MPRRKSQWTGSLYDHGTRWQGGTPAAFMLLVHADDGSATHRPVVVDLGDDEAEVLRNRLTEHLSRHRKEM